MRKLMCLALIALSAPLLAQSSPPGAQDEAEVRLHQDWPFLARYRADNAALPPATVHPRVVFMGDSITQGWFDMAPAFFVPGRIGRGIGGQTTPQMLLRFRQDVIDLHPDVVQIMAGTNDIAGNTGPMSLADTQSTLMSMTELAQAHGIRVILASVPPADHFPWRPGLETAPKIAAINSWLKGYAVRTGATYADYWGALHDGDALKSSLTYDGVHPNKQGYAVMAPVAEAAIRAAMARPAPRRSAR